MKTTEQASTGSEVHRSVSTKGSGGISVTVAVIARQGKVWMSLVPQFNQESIMEPAKVDELMRMLALAREDAKRMASSECVSRGGR